MKLLSFLFAAPNDGTGCAAAGDLKLGPPLDPALKGLKGFEALGDLKELLAGCPAFLFFQDAPIELAAAAIPSGLNPPFMVLGFQVLLVFFGAGALN